MLSCPDTLSTISTLLFIIYIIYYLLFIIFATAILIYAFFFFLAKLVFRSDKN